MFRSLTSNILFIKTTGTGYCREVPRERMSMCRKGHLGLGKGQLVVVAVGIQEGAKKKCLKNDTVIYARCSKKIILSRSKI